MTWSSEVSDLELVRLIHDDPQQGFTRLLQQYGGRIHGYLRQRFPSLHESDLHTAVTDAMLALVGSFDASRGALPAWFLLLAHQQAVSVLRSNRPVAELGATESWLDDVDRDVDSGVDSGDDPLAQLETLERLEEVERIIRTLPALERAVLEADLAEGRTAASQPLARRLETTAGSVYAARKRARAKLINRCGWVREYLQSGNTDHGSP